MVCFLMKKRRRRRRNFFGWAKGVPGGSQDFSAEKVGPRTLRRGPRSWTRGAGSRDFGAGAKGSKEKGTAKKGKEAPPLPSEDVTFAPAVSTDPAASRNTTTSPKEPKGTRVFTNAKVIMCGPQLEYKGLRLTRRPQHMETFV